MQGLKIEKDLKKKIIRVVILIEVLALLMGIKDYLNNRSFNGTIERPMPGELDAVREFTVSSEKGERDISVTVSPISRSSEEVGKLIEAAKREIDKEFIGGNKDLDHIIEDVVPKGSYQKGAVKAEWQFDNYMVVNPSGRILLENINEETIVKCQVTLRVEDYEEDYVFPMVLMPPDSSNEKGYSYLLDSSLKEANAKARYNESMELPKSSGGLILKWSPKETHRAIKLAVFGIVAGVLMIFADKEEKRRQLSNRKKLLDEDYPEIVSMLSLYVGAGISVKSAVQRIARGYRNKLSSTNEKRPGFEGICILERTMEDGKGEIESYKEFGKRMEHKDYRKLSIILVQNIRKGTAQLIKQLENEEQNAFDERKLRAKIAGEEASTKLLLPMMGLLGIVLVVLIFPAMQGLNI